MGKCRQALQEEGDVEKAVEWLRKRGMRSMERRTADSAEALLALALTPTAGAMVELRAETDFVTRGELFQQLSLALAETMAAGAATAEELLAAKPVGGPPQVAEAATVEAALLELGSVVGEKLVLGEVQHLQAPTGGTVGGYIHPKQADGLAGTGRMAALVALEATPATERERLAPLASRLARHVVGARPQYLSVSTIPPEVLQKEKETAKAAHLAQLDPKKATSIDEKVLDRVLSGKMQKFYQEQVLLSQELVAPGDAKPTPVAEALEAEARSLGLERVALGGFKLACL